MKRFLILCAALVGCVPAPKKDYTPAEVETVTELSELMRIHAKNADPLFAIRDQQSFTAAEYAQMKETGALIQATSAQLVTDFAPKFDAGFADFAKQLGGQATALSKAAEAEDAAAASAALGSMKEICAGCHGSYR